MSEERKNLTDDVVAQNVIDKYWERQGKPLFQYTILKETGELKTKGDEAVSYLLKIFEQYPDSPGILMLLVNHFYLKHDHHTAYIVAKILTFMYPDVGQFAKNSELMKILLDFEFAQGEESIREFGEAVDRWAEGVDL